MAIIIKPRKSLTSSAVPTTAQLADGEMAVNVPDKKIYVRDGSSIVEVANASGGGGGGSPVTAVIVISASATLDGSHLNAMLEKTGTTTLTMTLPASYGDPGEAILFVNNASSGNLVISRASGVSLWSYGTNANLPIPARRTVLLVKSTTANNWYRA